MTLQHSSDAKIEVIRQPQQLPCWYVDADGNDVQITEEMIQQAVSYTHLTLPTIYSV